MMKKQTRTWLSLLLAATLLFSVCGLAAYAETEETTQAPASTNIFFPVGTTVYSALFGLWEDGKILQINGAKAEYKARIGTGMTLVPSDGSKRTIIVMGDIDGDGTITAADARLIMRQIVELEHFKRDSAQYTAADVNKDGTLTLPDARLVLRATVGLDGTSYVPAVEPDYDNGNEYDILRSGSFYAVGAVKDSTGSQPLELAITPTALFMLTSMGNTELGVLRDANNNLYMLIPAKKIYVKIDKTLLDWMEMNVDELMNVEALGFSALPDLAAADSITDGEYNGVSCKVYTFTASGTNVYMKDSKLLGFANGASETYFSLVSAKVPTEKITPPADYEEADLLTFMAEMGLENY